MSSTTLSTVARRQKKWTRDFALVGALAAFIALQASAVFGPGVGQSAARTHATTAPATPAEVQPEPEHEHEHHQHEGPCVAAEDAVC